MQELHQSRQEKMPELLDMLKENFVQDDKGAWYVPDLTNAADLAKVRRKALLKEFWDSCGAGKGKLKVFRMEAIRAGFDECWKTRDFKTHRFCRRASSGSCTSGRPGAAYVLR